MIRTVTILTLAGAILLGACSGGSPFPTATGKGNVRAINAIEASPDIGFLIEESLISSVPYAGVSSFAEWDDINFTFNFDVFIAGGTSNTRIASRNLDVVADQDYTFLISGTVASPVITLWEIAEREFNANDTVLRARFAHTSATLGAVDYYFADAGVAPVLGEQVATLTLGEISDPVDLESGPFAITITAAGDPTTVLFSSAAVNFVAQTDLIVTLFDGTAQINAPYVVQAITTQGTSLPMLDTSIAPTVEFLNGSLALGASDIYDDAGLTSQLVTGHDFKDLSAPIPVAAGEQTFRYTPVTPPGVTPTLTFESTTTVLGGLQYRAVALGEPGAFVVASSTQDSRPIDTAAKILVYQTSTNFDAVTFYVLPRGEVPDTQLPLRAGVSRGLTNAASGVAAGSYDVFVTDFGTTDILDGPVPIDVALGDVVDIVVFDTVDPAVLDIEIL